MRDHRTLVFSVAFNGYDSIWAKPLRSQKAYATSKGYDYTLLGQGVTTPLAMESAWMKIPLLIAAMDAGYDWIAFIDADAEIKERCPSLDTLAQGDKSVFLANGFSGRPNTGVIIVRNSPSARRFLKAGLNIAGQRLPPKDRVGWGENGEVIHLARKSGCVAIIDGRWNNNHQTELEDYIRHYTGPMRKAFPQMQGERSEVGKAGAASTFRLPGSRDFFTAVKQLLMETPSPEGYFNLDPVLGEIAALEAKAASVSGRVRTAKNRMLNVAEAKLGSAALKLRAVASVKRT